MSAADDSTVREAFVAYMASVGVTGVVWTAELGPMGTRHHKSALLSVAWMDFAAGYAAAIAAEREAAAKACDERAAKCHDIAQRWEKQYDGKDESPLAEANQWYIRKAEAESNAAAIRARGAS